MVIEHRAHPPDAGFRIGQGLAGAVYRALSDWLRDAWPFENLRYAPRL